MATGEGGTSGSAFDNCGQVVYHRIQRASTFGPLDASCVVRNS